MKKKAEGGGSLGGSGSFEIELYTDHIENKVKVALLEQSIGHINQTLIRIEKSLESSNNSTDKRLDRLDSKIEILDRKIDSRFLWLLSFCFGGFTGLGGVMAHGFHWI